MRPADFTVCFLFIELKISAKLLFLPLFAFSEIFLTSIIPTSSLFAFFSRKTKICIEILPDWLDDYQPIGIYSPDTR